MAKVVIHGFIFWRDGNVQLLEKSEKLATANDEDFSFQTLLGLVDAALEYDGVNEVHVPSWGLDSDEIWKNGIVLAKNDPPKNCRGGSVHVRWD